MPNDLEKAIHGLVKIVVQEVVSDLQSRGLLVNLITSEQDSDSDDLFLLRAKEVAERLAISERHLHKMTVEGVIPWLDVFGTGNVRRSIGEVTETFFKDNLSWLR